MGIKNTLTGLVVGLSLMGLNIATAQAISLTMSFDIAFGGNPDNVSGIIKYDTDGNTLAIDTLTFVDLTIEGVVYNVADLGFGSAGDESQVYGGTGPALEGDDFLLTFNHVTGAGVGFSYSTAPPVDSQGQGDSYSSQEISITRTTSNAIPEPTTLALLGLGLTLLGASSRKRK